MSAPARFDRAVQHSNAKVALLGQGVIVLLEVARVVHHLPVIFSAEILQGWDCWLARSQSVYRIEFLLCYYFICIVFVRFNYDVCSVFSLQDLLSELTTDFKVEICILSNYIILNCIFAKHTRIMHLLRVASLF